MHNNKTFQESVQPCSWHAEDDASAAAERPIPRGSASRPKVPPPATIKIGL